jgi:hypothetical protein
MVSLNKTSYSRPSSEDALGVVFFAAIFRSDSVKRYSEIPASRIYNIEILQLFCFRRVVGDSYCPWCQNTVTKRGKCGRR